MTVLRAAAVVKQGLCAMALALSVQVVHAAAPQWQINPGGTGPGGASAVSLLNVGGVGFVEIFPDANGGSSYSFVEHGAYRALQADMASPFGEQDLTVAYTVAGTGSTLNPFALRFTSGTIDLYSDSAFDFGTAASHYGADNGTHIAGFSVFDGSVAASGLVTVQARLLAGSLHSGYLFAADGSDLATHNSVLMELGIFSNETITPDDLVVSGVVCGMASYAGPGCNGKPFSNSPWARTVRDGGYATIASVPEPEMISMLLAGLGLIGAAARRRRSSAR